MTKREIKAAARATLARVTESLASRIAFIDSKREAFEGYIGRFEVLAAMDLAAGFTAKRILTTPAKARTWRDSALPGRSVGTIARWTNAGTVALILAGDESKPNLLGEVPNATIGHLVPLYRILTAAKRTPEGVAAAEDLIRTTWQDLCKGCDEDEVELEDGTVVPTRDAPDISAVLAAAEAVAPTNRGGGSSSATTSDEDDDESGDEDEDESGESRRESADGLTVVDATAVEAASKAWVPQSRTLADEYSPEAVQAIGLAVLRFASEYGTGTMQHVLSGTLLAAAAAAEVPQDEKSDES